MGIEELKGKTIIKIDGMKEESDYITFECSDETMYVMKHSQSCCEYVRLYDITGEVESLLNNEITMAEESESNAREEDIDYDSSHTWTFYKLATVKGYVTLRWLGESNGYYSESVDFEEI